MPRTVAAFAPRVGPVARAITDWAQGHRRHDEPGHGQAQGTDPNLEGRWRRRFAEQGREGRTKERPRAGGRASKPRPSSEAR